MPIVSVPKILRSKLGDDGAEALVEFFNEMQAANSPKEEIIEIVEEKFERRLAEELGKLRIEMAEMKSELLDEMAKMKSELRDEMAEIKSELRNEIAEMKSEFRSEMAKTESGLRNEMAEMKSELRNEMGNMESRLNNKILELQADSAKKHADLIKWMFIFWVGQIGVFVGILLAFFK